MQGNDIGKFTDEDRKRVKKIMLSTLTSTRLFFQEMDFFSPGYRHNGDMFEVNPYYVTVTHVADYNAYKVLNMQVSSMDSQEVSVVGLLRVNFCSHNF